MPNIIMADQLMPSGLSLLTEESVLFSVLLVEQSCCGIKDQAKSPMSWIMEVVSSVIDAKYYHDVDVFI